jgi:DNA repair exonuclease SbcCD ATPase subunit
LIITHLKLTHWCQHIDFETDFSPTTNGIVGTNGKGKSNLVRAIRFAITGRTDKDDTLSADITEGCESAKVELGIEHNGVTGVIRRRIYHDSPNFAEIEYGEDHVKGVSKVNKYIEELLCTSSDSVERFSFVAQERLRAVLFDSASARMESLIAMIPEIAISRILRNRVNEFLSTIPEIVLPYDKEYVESRIVALSKDIVEEEKKIDQAKSTIDTLGDKSVYLKLIETAKENKSRKERLQSYNKSRAELNSKLEAITEQLSKVELPDISSLGEDFDAEEARNIVRDYHAFDFAKYDSAKTFIGSGAIEQLQDWKNSVESKKEALQNKHNRVTELERAVSSLSGQALSKAEAFESRWIAMKDNKNENSCPVCGSSVKPGLLSSLREADEAEIEGIRVQYSEKRKELDAANRDYVASCSEASDLERKYHELQTKIDRAQVYLTSVSVPEYTKDDIAELENNLRIKQAYDNSVKICSEYENEAKTILAGIKGIDDLSVDDTADIEDIPDSEVVRAEEAVSAIRGAQNNLDVSEEMVSRYEEELEKANEMLDKLEEVMASKAEMSEFRQKVLLLKELLHRDNIPKQALSYYMEALRSRLSFYMSQFATPLTIMIDDDFDISFTKNGSTPCAIKRLSGGEKSVVSTALHLAVSDMFRGNLDLLALDEPSQNMDEEYVSSFIPVIEHASDSEGGRQLIVVTHHVSEMAAAFDNIIAL